MEENHIYVALGALGALLSTLVLLLLVDLWTQIAVPLWRRWRYRGVNIAGGWKGLGTGHPAAPGEWTEVGMSLEQQLDELRGLLWIRRCTADASQELRLPLAGRISGGYVALTPAQEGEAPAPVSALLKIDGRGASLNGQLLYRDPATDVVEAIEMSVHRAATMALPRLRPIAASGSAMEGMQAAALGVAAAASH